MGKHVDNKIEELVNKFCDDNNIDCKKSSKETLINGIKQLLIDNADTVNIKKVTGNLTF
jgi:hypothetical protein